MSDNIDISDLIGVPFERHGRDVNVGLDCVGLADIVLRRTGQQGLLEFPYTYDGDVERSHDQLIKYSEMFESIDRPEPWCIIGLMIVRPFMSHIGVVLPDCRHFIHVMSASKTIIERIDNIRWEGRVKGFWKRK